MGTHDFLHSSVGIDSASLPVLGMGWEDVFWEPITLFLRAEEVSDHPSWKHMLFSIPCKSSQLELAPLGFSYPTPEA